MNQNKKYNNYYNNFYNIEISVIFYLLLWCSKKGHGGGLYQKEKL